MRRKNIDSILMKKATGYFVEETVEEYDRDKEVTKCKVSKKYIPPDTTAIKAVLERTQEDPLKGYTDKQLEELRIRLLKELEKIKEKEEQNAGSKTRSKDKLRDADV